MEASTPTDGSRKRSRKPKTFAGYVTETNDGYFEEGLAAASAGQQQQQQQPPPPPQTKRRRSSTASVSGLSTPRRQQHQNASSGLVATTPAAGGSVKKVAGVQNATKRALEWLQYGDLSVSELTQSLPKLSKARVEIVMEALRAAGLVTLVRKHSPDAAGEDHVTEVYRFSAGRSAAEALEIGGGKPVALGSISKRIKTSQAELVGLNERINVLKEAAKSDPDPQQVLDILRQFMKQDKTLEEDAFYSVAYKATCAVANKAAAAAAAATARAAAVAQAKKKAAEDAATAAAASEARRKSQEAVRRQREQEAAALQVRRAAEESEGRAEAKATTTVDYMAASSASTTVVAAAAFSAAVSSAALPTVSGSVVSTAPSSTLPSVEMRMSPAAPAPSSPPAVATAVAASAPPPAPFVGELGGLVVSGVVSPRSIPPPPSDAQQQ